MERWEGENISYKDPGGHALPIYLCRRETSEFEKSWGHLLLTVPSSGLQLRSFYIQSLEGLSLKPLLVKASEWLPPSFRGPWHGGRGSWEREMTGGQDAVLSSSLDGGWVWTGNGDTFVAP